MVRLMPHQEELRKKARNGSLQFPVYLIWSMGSGKTLGGLACAHAVGHASRATRKILVLCPKTLTGQWTRMIDEYIASPSLQSWNVQFQVHHYERLNTENLDPAKYDMVIVDEASAISKHVCEASPVSSQDLGLRDQTHSTMYAGGVPFRNADRVRCGVRNTRIHENDAC